MKVLYYSTLSFTDCDFPLIREYQRQGIKCKYMLSLLSTKLSGALFKISKQIPQSDIIEGKKYHEFEPYRNYLNLSDLHVINRTKRGLHPLNILLYLKLIIFIIRFKPDVIHITHPLWGPELLLYIFASKIALTVHDPFVHSGEGDKTEHRARNIAFHLCRKLILLNDKQKDMFIKHYQLQKKRVYVNSLGIYDSMRVVESNTEKQPYSKYILLFGRISPYKGIDVLCEAMRLVHEKLPDIHCVIAGGGKMYFDYSPYENLPYIHLLNHFIDTPELGELIKGSLFTVCPYKDATQSGVVYSSLAYNKPIIASNVGALGDAVIDGKTGILVKPNDTKELAEAIVKLAGQEDLLSKMSAEISEVFVDGKQSWNVIANKYIAIYKD